VIFADSGSVLTVAERSSVIDPYLILYDVNFDLVAFNDDSADLGTTPNAYLVDTLPQTGVYILDIGTFFQGQTGAYTLAIAAASTAASQRAGAVEAAPITLAPLRGVKGRWVNLVGVPAGIGDLRGAKRRR